MKNYYEILQVDTHATAGIIRKIFKYHIKINHPDLFQGDAKLAAEAKVKELNEAYEILSDTQKRKEYDEALAYTQQQEIADHSFSLQRLQEENDLLRQSLQQKDVLLQRCYQELGLDGYTPSLEDSQKEVTPEIDYLDNNSIASYYLGKVKTVLFKFLILLVTLFILFTVLSILTKANVFQVIWNTFAKS